MKKVLLSIAALVAIYFSPASARADSFNAITGITGVDGSLPSVEGKLPVASSAVLVAIGGEVDLYFAGYSASDLDLLLNGNTTIFANQTTSLGTKFDLGNFAAGTVITLTLENTDTGQKYFTGPASGNPDDMVHAAYAPWTANSAVPVNGTFIGFEDLPNGSADGDYNDLMAIVSGANPVPEPGTWVLLGTGLLAIFLARRRSAMA